MCTSTEAWHTRGVRWGHETWLVMLCTTERFLSHMLCRTCCVALEEEGEDSWHSARSRRRADEEWWLCRAGIRYHHILQRMDSLWCPQRDCYPRLKRINRAALFEAVFFGMTVTFMNRLCPVCVSVCVPALMHAPLCVFVGRKGKHFSD